MLAGVGPGIYRIGWPTGQFPMERSNPTTLSVEPGCPAARVTLVRNDNV
ncbi:MAG: hypothetical protein JXA98_08885 [Methanosarcinaceae archaeon]|nr:hypothetical protein [Methanosarcinaceae archaeon]